MSSVQPESAHIEPVDDETPDETPGNPGPNADANAFPRLLTRLSSKSLQFQPKLWEPNPLDSSDPENSELSSSSANSTLRSSISVSG